MTSTRLALTLTLSLVCGCGTNGSDDAGPGLVDASVDLGRDLGRTDSGAGDLGSTDSGSTDSGAVDSGSADAGPVADAGPAGPAALCTATGGTVGTNLCCMSVDDFADMCGGIGACGCSPTYSHDVQVCDCPSGMCFSPTMGCH